PRQGEAQGDGDRRARACAALPHSARARGSRDRMRPGGKEGLGRMAQISVAMMTHNETAEFRWLMEALVPALDVIDEIVVVDDFSGPEFTAAVRELEDTMPLRFFQRALGKNFAAQRNYMKSLCRGRLIFFLDP